MGSGASTTQGVSDIDTPRGVTAKEEVKRLRAVIAEKDHDLTRMLAVARFRELDKDNSGQLEKSELYDVVDWVIQAYGKKIGSNKDDIKSKIMLRLDTNKDGKLDMDEFLILFNEMAARFSLMDRARAKFIELDTDKSNFLEAGEIDKVVAWALEAYSGSDPAAYKASMMAKIDSNLDGKIDIEEFMVLFEDMLVRLSLLQSARGKFEELDVDKSGFLEAGEIDRLVELVLAAYVEKPVEERAKFQKTLISQLDKNKDGKLDIREFTDLWEEMMKRMSLISDARVKFNELDKDGSGYLEFSELTPVVKTWAVTLKKESQVDVEVAMDEMMRGVDVNSDGKLSLLEFVEIFDKVLSENGVWI